MIYTKKTIEKEFSATVESLKARGYILDPEVKSCFTSVPFYAMLNAGDNQAVVCVRVNNETGEASLNCTYIARGHGGRCYTLLKLYKYGPPIAGTYTDNKAEAEAYITNAKHKLESLGHGCDRAVPCCW